MLSIRSYKRIPRIKESLLNQILTLHDCRKLSPIFSRSHSQGEQQLVTSGRSNKKSSSGFKWQTKNLNKNQRNQILIALVIGYEESCKTCANSCYTCHSEICLVFLLSNFLELPIELPKIVLNLFCCIILCIYLCLSISVSKSSHIVNNIFVVLKFFLIFFTI